MIRFLILFCAVLTVNCSQSQKVLIQDEPVLDWVRLNQVGYYPSAPKHCVVADCTVSDFHIVDTMGNIVYTSSFKDAGKWEQSGERLFTGNFSDFSQQGYYHIYIPSIGLSPSFKINDSLYDDIFRASLKSYYYQRASMELKPEYAGKWARKPGHPDTACKLHESTGKTGVRSAPKGWYDAGDFGKYVTPSGITVSTLLSLYERFPDAAGDRFTNIPESKNNQSDLLDEARYQIDWLKSMQDEDGGVFFKLSGLSWPGFIMPEEDTLTRYIIGKSTTSTLAFAGIMAQAARIYKSNDSEYSKDCLQRAKAAWRWAGENPGVEEPKETGGSGGYGDEQHGWLDTTCAGQQYLKKRPDVYRDEFLWAASELFITTGEKEFKHFIQNNLAEFTFIDVPTWWDLQGLAYYSLLTVENSLEKQYKDTIQNRVLSAAQNHLKTIEQNPYRIPYECFFWGSNASFLNVAILFSYAYTITGDEKFLHAITETVDYVFGKNATGYCFVTGFGHKYPKAIHHRQSEADSVDEPIPGFVVGGPNMVKQDDIEKVSWGAKYPHKEPARSFVDDKNSYAANEIALNWSAPLVHILGFLVANQ